MPQSAAQLRRGAPRVPPGNHLDLDFDSTTRDFRVVRGENSRDVTQNISARFSTQSNPSAIALTHPEAFIPKMSYRHTSAACPHAALFAGHTAAHRGSVNGFHNLS